MSNAPVRSSRREAVQTSHPETEPGLVDSTTSVPPALLLAGQTAVGKSDVALVLARQLGGEIVSADSMQVYRGLDIGTAKPAPSERAMTPHHLIDVVECHEPFDVARFVVLAREAVAGIQARHRVPIVCGGTGLYFKVLLEGLGNAPPANPALRAELEQVPLDALLEELRHKDPETFGRIDRGNPRRVLRAVEVLRLTGRLVSSSRAPWRSADAVEADDSLPIVFGLRRETYDLRVRMEARVDRMFAQGLVEETQRLLARGLGDNPTAQQAIGYRQVIEHLEGQRGRLETIELVKIKTRQFAKRQMTWLRRQLPVTWIDVGRDDSPHTVAEAILRHYNSRAN